MNEEDIMDRDQFARASNLYDEGRYEEAFQQFLSLANQGDIDSMTRVASMYGDGRGVSYSFQESINWDMKAAEAGDEVAMFNLGISYRNKGDTRNAKRWFEKALAAGDGDAALELAKMFLISELEIDRVRGYLREALADPCICEASREEAKRLLQELC
jgi:uncharacterized protein